MRSINFENCKQTAVICLQIVRKRDDGEYELISGHRRKHACEIVGVKEIPAIIKDLSDDDATIIMVDANIQREELDPSELAYAFKCKRDALSHKGIKADMNSSDEIGANIGKSGRQVNRYIRLTYLINAILELVDLKRIVVGAGVELSYLSTEEQEMLLNVIAATNNYPNIKQAIEIRNLHEQGKLNYPVIEVILQNEKAESSNISLDQKVVGSYFPKGTSKNKMKELIYKLLEDWKNQGGVI